MTKDDIIRMAREAGLADGIELDREIAEFERFANLIAAAEREACAKVCDEQEQRSKESSEAAKQESIAKLYHHCSVTATWNAAAIRARGQE